MKKDLDIKKYGKNLPSNFIYLYSLGSIIKSYKYIRQLEYSEKPDYNKLKYFVLKDLENQGLSLNGSYDWTLNPATLN